MQQSLTGMLDVLACPETGQPLELVTRQQAEQTSAPRLVCCVPRTNGLPIWMLISERSLTSCVARIIGRHMPSWMESRS